MDDAEKLSRPLGPGRAPSAADVQAQDLDPGLRAALLHDAAARAAAYLEGLDARGVQADAAAVAALQRLHQPLAEQGTAAGEVLALLDEVVSPATLGIAGRRFFGFVTGGALPVTVAANTLATAWDQNSCYHHTTPGTATLEAVALDWLRELLALPVGTGAGFVTGATVANATALAAARHAVLERAGWDVEADGLFGAPPIRVVVGGGCTPRCASRWDCSAWARTGWRWWVRTRRGDSAPTGCPSRRVRRSSSCRPATSTPAPSTPSPRSSLGLVRRGLGARGRGLRVVGAREPGVTGADGRPRAGGLVGDRLPQVAQRSL